MFLPAPIILVIMYVIRHKNNIYGITNLPFQISVSSSAWCHSRGLRCRRHQRLFAYASLFSNLFASSSSLFSPLTSTMQRSSAAMVRCVVVTCEWTNSNIKTLDLNEFICTNQFRRTSRHLSISVQEISQITTKSNQQLCANAFCHNFLLIATGVYSPVILWDF